MVGMVLYSVDGISGIIGIMLYQVAYLLTYGIIGILHSITGMRYPVWLVWDMQHYWYGGIRCGWYGFIQHSWYGSLR